MKLNIKELDELQMETGESLRNLIENHYQQIHHVELEYIGLNADNERFIYIKVYVTQKSYRAVKLEFNTLVSSANVLKDYFTKFHDALVSDDCESYVDEQQDLKIINQYLN